MTIVRNLMSNLGPDSHDDLVSELGHCHVTRLVVFIDCFFLFFNSWYEAIAEFT